mmetsp:Transcript_53028/g.133998  ORF Transcript_53028/g.133998 Transcript_53028/m.133998 type:complete len:226 (+) Transcript_53028:527-1204(+)
MLHGCQCSHMGPQWPWEILLCQRQALPRRGPGADLGPILRGNENHRLEPWVLNATGLVLQVLASIGCQTLRHCGRHLQHLLRDIPRQLLPVKDMSEAQRQGGGAKIDETVALVLLGGEVRGQVEEVEGAFESSLDHVMQKLLWRVAVRDVPQHHGCCHRRPLALDVFAPARLRLGCAVRRPHRRCRQARRWPHGRHVVEGEARRGCDRKFPGCRRWSMRRLLCSH